MKTPKKRRIHVVHKWFRNKTPRTRPAGAGRPMVARRASVGTRPTTRVDSNSAIDFGSPLTAHKAIEPLLGATSDDPSRSQLEEEKTQKSLSTSFELEVETGDDTSTRVDSHSEVASVSPPDACAVGDPLLGMISDDDSQSLLLVKEKAQKNCEPKVEPAEEKGVIVRRLPDGVRFLAGYSHRLLAFNDLMV